MLVCSVVADNPPDYELADRMVLTSPSQVKAIGHPLRTTILQLLHERAATVTELATAVVRMITGDVVASCATTVTVPLPLSKSSVSRSST